MAWTWAVYRSVAAAVARLDRAVRIQFDLEIDWRTVCAVTELHSLPAKDNSAGIRLEHINVGVSPARRAQIQVVPHAGNHLERRQVADGTWHIIGVAV